MTGEVTEWLKVHAWNACVRKYREFESHPLRHEIDLSVIAGSCATKNHELRQVREEAAAVNLFVCYGGARLSFFCNQAHAPHLCTVAPVRIAGYSKREQLVKSVAPATDYSLFLYGVV